MKNVFLVLGPPGTGKTESLRRWLEAQAEVYSPENVVACSYTKTAAREIASRVKGIPKENVGTLHSLCYRALGRPKLTIGKEKQFNEETGNRFRISPTFHDVDDPYSDQMPQVNAADDFMAEMDVMRARMVRREAWKPHVRSFAKVWDDWKDQNQYVDFSDLLEIAYRDLDTAPGNPAIGAVDEAQDSSKLQVSLILKWAKHMTKLVMVLDEDQCLYDWCGADPGQFLNLGVPAENTTVLPQSSRVPRVIHAMSEAWIKKIKRRRDRTYLPRDFDGSIERSNGTTKWPNPAVELAERYTATGKSVMILAACNAGLERLKHTLRERAIPFHNPYRHTRGDWNPLLPGTKKIVRPIDRVLSLLSVDGRTFEEPRETWTWHDLWSWAEPLAASGVFKRGAKEWLKDKKLNHEKLDTQELYEWIDPEKGFDWLDKISFATREQTTASLEHWLRQVLPERREVLKYPAEIAMKRGGSTLLEDPKVSIGTIHSVKGGQADVVIVFPDISRAAYRGWMTGGMLADAVRRMFFVAFTRARETLVLCQSSGPLSVEIPA